MVSGTPAATCKNIKVDYFLTPYAKINSKCNTGLNIRPETIKLIEENIGSTLFDIRLSNSFMDLSPQARETKARTKNKQMGPLETEKLLAQLRKLSTKQKPPTEWEKIFANGMSNT